MKLFAFRSRALESAPHTLDLGSGAASCQMVVDETHRLHERVGSRRANEPPASLAQVLAHCGSLWAELDSGQRLVVEASRQRRRLEAPHVGSETPKLSLQLAASASVVDRGGDLRGVAHDPLVVEQPLLVGTTESRYRVWSELGEGGTKVLALTKDRQPAQT